MSSAAKRIDVIGTIKDGVGIGIQNIGPIIVNFLLWIITIWIPYLNVGTTIGMMVGIVSKASKGEMIPFTEIFDPKYRKYMGEYFLVNSLVMMGIVAALPFFFIPGIVIGISWMFATIITVDKGKNPSEAITLSNNATYGNKWRIFFVSFLLGLVAGLLGWIFSLPGGAVSIILVLILMLFMSFIVIGVQASLYRQLTSDI